jgi:hypothetical protein
MVILLVGVVVTPEGWNIIISLFGLVSAFLKE